MKSLLTVTAPGKLFLIGEYAVLDGVPAVLAAVEPKVLVRFDTTDHAGQLVVEAPQLRERLVPSARSLPEPEGPLRFVLSTLREFAVELPARLSSGLRIQVQTPQMEGSSKLGLGFSAAICAAVAAGLWRLLDPGHSPDLERDTIFARAFRAHRAAQDGAGSGADVAASVYGGVITFENGESPRIETFPTGTNWPELVVAWTGRPAATTDWIARYRCATQHSPAAHARFLQRTRLAVRTFAEAFRSGNYDGASFEQAVHAFREFCLDTHLPAWTPEIATALAVAGQVGIPAKWSGAGGGDCVFGLAPDPSSAERLRTAWQTHGFPTVDIRWAREGVTVVESA